MAVELNKRKETAENRRRGMRQYLEGEEAEIALKRSAELMETQKRGRK